jgi:hypothetical protein
VIDLLVTALGIDAAQWRALLRTYVRIDFRAAGGPSRRRRGATRSSQLLGLAIVGALGSVAFGFVAAASADVMMTASLLTTYAAATTTMMVLVDFTGLVLAPEDYAILAPRPVSSRTYFAARLAAVGVYVGTLSLANAVVPAMVYGVKTGPLAFPATLAAVVLCDLSTAVLVITAYVSLLRWVHPAKLKRAVTYVQLVGSTAFYGMYYLATVGFRHAFLDRVGFESAAWLWAVPSTWFAAVIAVAAGGAPTAAWIAAEAALLVTLLCVPLAAGRLSLEYARQVGEASAVAEAVPRGRSFRLPGFARGEARAVALLVRAQFRFDQRFRMGVLSIIPLTGFYLLMGLDQGALLDPFVGAARGPGVYFAVFFIPMTLHTALAASESWRAAWIFFATPSSHARVVVAAKNFVSVYFLGTYVLALAVFWSYFYERVWHALLHALMLGGLAHILLQLAVIARPALPFAAEPHKAQRSSSTFLLFLVAGIVAGVFPSLLSIVYQSAVATVLTCVVLLGVTIAIEYALRLRVEEVTGDLEFRQ